MWAVTTRRIVGQEHAVAQRLVVIGGSAGSLDALRQVVAKLPGDFPAPILVAIHLAADAESHLPEILGRDARLPVRHARHGDELQAGVILVARPDRHLVVHEDFAHLSRGPRENRHRPSVDALFNSAARWHGPAVVGVVLSGALDDGSAGAAAIAAQDGTVVVQHPQDAQVSGMPRAALAAVRRARAAPAPELATLLTHIVGEAAATDAPEVDGMVEWEAENVDSVPVEQRGPHPGVPAALGCPECHGGMFEADASGRLHYLCHVGHSWSPASLLAAQREASEAALYGAAARLLEEAAVLKRLATAAEPDDEQAVAEASEHLRRAGRAEARAAEIQNMLRDVE